MSTSFADGTLRAIRTSTSTVVQNAEARYEYYFGRTDLVAVTAFFKYFDKPIEFVILNQVNSTASFKNADSAWLVGGELEIRLDFRALPRQAR